MRIKQPIRKNKLNLKILTDGKVQNELIAHIESWIELTQDKILNVKSEISIEKTWQSFKISITEVAKNKLGQITKAKKKTWITDKIFNLMNQEEGIQM